MYIRRLTANDTQPYSDIRLKALKDHPDAFAVSYDEEKEWPSEKFKARLEAGNAIVLGAFEQDRLIGILKISKQTHCGYRFYVYFPQTPRVRRGKSFNDGSHQPCKKDEGHRTASPLCYLNK
ncbi:hypothetical protein GE573_01946 [Bacillus velezensis]|nr:hypothetical protein GE573_01946 [Bacillus velezensis]